MTEKLTENSTHQACAAVRGARDAGAVAAANPYSPSFFRWLWEGLRASILLRPRIGQNASIGPWKLALLVLSANGVAVMAERALSAGDVLFYYEGWLLQWSFCLFVLWMAWCFMPRGNPQSAPSPARVLAWFALQSWALMPPFLLGLYLIAWRKSAGDEGPSPLLQYIALGAAATAWVIAVAFRLSRPFFGGWWRTFWLMLMLGLSGVLMFWNVETAFWISSEEDAAQVEVVPGDEESDDGDEGEDGDTLEPPELLEALHPMPVQHSARQWV